MSISRLLLQVMTADQSGARSESAQAGPSTFPQKKQVCILCFFLNMLLNLFSRLIEVGVESIPLGRFECHCLDSSQKGTDCRYNFFKVCLKKTNLPSKFKKTSSKSSIGLL